MVYSQESVEDKDNEYNEDSKKPELKIDLPLFDFPYQTKGRIAGNEYLSGNASVRLGVSFRF